MRNLNNERITLQSLNPSNIEAIDTVVVVDVYRAFTTAAVALENGASGIIIVDDIAEALALRAAGKGSICIGERNGVMPDGFDFGNSPAEIASTQLKGETLIQTTTNGTRGIKAVSSVPNIYAGSLVTATATASSINQQGNDQQVLLLAMGHGGHLLCEEDEQCAQYIRARLNGDVPDKIALANHLRDVSASSDTLAERIEPMSPEDVDWCLRVDALSFAVRVHHNDGQLTATKEFL